MKWYNLYGLIIIVAMMIPNSIYAIKHKEGFVNLWQNKTIEIFEQIGRFGCFGFMIFNIPGTYLSWLSDNSLKVYLMINGLLLVAYLVIWILCFNENSIFRSLALSILPSLIFLVSGIIERSILLIISAIIFAPCHILISYKNAKLGLK